MSKNKEKDLISIIIPAYNSEKVIVPCLDSLASQTIKNFEAIVINDGSTDNTLEVVNSYKDKIENLVVITKKNEGQGVARNIGLEKAKGNYIMFVDSDDILENDYLETMINEITSGDYDICISGHQNVNTNYECFAINRVSDNNWSKYVVCVPWSKLFKSSLIKDNNLLFPDIRYGEDTAFSIVAISHTSKIKYSNSIGYCQYIYEESLSRSYIKEPKVEVQSANKYILDNINKDYYKEHEKELWYFFIKHSLFIKLWSGKTENKETFLRKNKEMITWLEENVDMYKKNKVPSIFYPKGEKLKVRLVVHIYMLLNKLGMINLFASFYCKG